MEIERKALLCFMLGFIQGHTGSPGKDARIILDQKLLEMNQSCVTEEETEYLEDLKDEIDFALMMMGVNRKQARALGIKKR